MASADPIKQESSVELSEEAKKLVELKKASEAADARDEEIEKAIVDAFRGVKERLTIERINNLKTVLNDIIELQIEAQKKNQTLTLQYFIDTILQNKKNTIDEVRLTEIFELLKIAVKSDVAPAGAEEAQEEKEAKEDINLGADNLAKTYQNKELIIGIDKILEGKKRKEIMDNLSDQDHAVTGEFAVGVRKILEKRKETPGVNKYATSGAVLVGGTCLGTGINMIIVAGSIAAAGAFPIGLAVLGGVIIIGAGLYYAHKKRGRIGEFLPSLYGKARLLRKARIEQLDGEERHKQLEKLTKKYDKKNEKNQKLAKQKIIDYEKKRGPEYNRICDKIEELQTELDTVNEVLEPSSPIDLKALQEKFSSNDSKAYDRVLLVKSAPPDEERNTKAVYLVKNELVGEVVAHYYNGIKWCQAIKKSNALDQVFTDKDKKEWNSSSEIEKIISICGCVHFKHMIAFQNINNFNNLADFRDRLRDRKRHIQFGKEGSQEVEDELANVRAALADNSAADFEAFKKTHESKKIRDINIEDYTSIESYKSRLTKRAKLLEVQRERSLVQLKELKKKNEDSLQALETAVNSSLEQESEANTEQYKLDSSLLETKPMKGNESVKLPWYKKIVPYFAYWGTCIALNFKSTAAAAKEASEVAKAAIEVARETNAARGGDSAVLPPELKAVADVAETMEKAREQFEARVGEVVESLKLKIEKSDFYDYLTVEECYLSDEDFKKKIARVVSGENIKNTMLKIFYTHPSTVLSLFDKNPSKTTTNINESLKDVEQHLKKFSDESKCLNSLQIYFPRDKTNHTDYTRFMLVSDEKDVKAQEQEAFFEHMFLIKQSIMEVNKTLETVSKVSPNDFEKVRDGIKDSVENLILAATPVAEEIEKQLEALNIAEESLQYREVYINIFKGFSEDDNLSELIKKANIGDAIFISDAACWKDFAEDLQKRQKELERLKKGPLEENGILNEFIKLFSTGYVTKAERFAFFQKIKSIEAANKAANKEDAELELLQKQYVNFYERRNFRVTDIKKLDDSNINGTKELKEYIEDNEHSYHSQKVLIEEKRGILEEVQKSLVLSIPEIETTLKLKPTYAFRRIAKRRRISSYGIPYNPSISLSMDYILNLFKSTRATFGNMKGLLFKFKFSEMNIKSIHLNLNEILFAIDDPNIPISIENALKFLRKIRFPGFDVMFGPLFRELEKEGAVLSKENHTKIVNAIKGLRDFLANIQPPWSGLTFPDLIKKIHGISLEIGKLTFRLTQLNPCDVNDALEIKEIILKLKLFKLDLDKLNIGKIDFKGLVGELPDGFPFKNQLGRFVTSFDPLFKDFDIIYSQFGKFNLDKFPLDDFLYICNCYQGFEKFGGFKNLALQFPVWLKEYENGFNWNPFGSPDDAGNDDKIKLDKIRIQLEKFIKFKMCLGSVGEFLGANGEFKFPAFLALPGFPNLPENLKTLNMEFNRLGDISLDDISFIIDFLGSFGGIEGLTTRLKSLGELIASLTLRIGKLNGLNGIELEKLKNDLKEATREFEMFQNFSLKIEKLSVVLPKIPGMPEMDFPKFTGEYKTFLESFGTGLSGINLSVDLYNIKSAFSDFNPNLRFDIKSLRPSFPKAKAKAKEKEKSKTKASLKFNLDFGDIDFADFDLKVISLDEIIRRVEQLRDLNNGAKARLDEALQHPMADNIKKAIGIEKGQEDRYVGEINKVHEDIKQGLAVTLLSLYALRATIAIINAIKRGDGTAAVQELKELAEKAAGLQSDIKLLVDELNMLKAFGSKSESELEKIALLKKDLASKEEDLKEVKLGLLEFKRMREAFAYLDTVNYKEPPISEMMKGIESKAVEDMVNQGKAIVGQVKEFLADKDPIDAALAAVEVSEITLKLVPFVDIMQNSDPQNIKSEFSELIKASTGFKNLIDKERAGKSNQEEKLLKLNDIKNKLLGLKQLTERASELSNVDFAKPSYAAVLKSLGLSGDRVKLLVENTKDMPSKDIDDALRHLADAEYSLKLALLEKRVAVIKEAKPLLDFLKQEISAGNSNFDDIFAKWKSSNQAQKKELNFFALGNAVKNVEDLLKELESIPDHGDSSFTPRLAAIKISLGEIEEIHKRGKQATVKGLFSNIYDFVNVAATEQVNAKVNELKKVLKAEPNPGLIINIEEQKNIDEFVKRIDSLMEKFEAYRKFVQMFNELKIKNNNSEKINSEDLVIFEALREKAKGLDDDIEFLLKFKKHFHKKLNIVPVSVHEALNRVPVSEKKIDSEDPFDILGDVNSPKLEQVEDKSSAETVKVERLKDVLSVFDNFYYLNSAQDIHQKLEPAESFFQFLKAREVQKSTVHNPGFLPSGGPHNKTQAEADAPKPEDLTQKKPGPPPPP